MVSQRVSEVFDHDDIHRAICAVMARLTELRGRIKDRVLVGTRAGLLVYTRMQAIFNERYANDLEQRLHELVLIHAIAAERLGPGGFDRCIESLLQKFVRLRDGDNTVIEPRDTGDIVGTGVTRATMGDVEWVLSAHGSSMSTLTSGMLRQAVDMAGFAGRIFVERARNRPSVELVRGYAFNLSPVWNVNARLDGPKVVCIDGYVEQVSELHYVLEAASDTKESVLLFVRGLSDDVLHTLRVNYDRGSLRVVPVIVRFELEGINTLNDICVVAGADLVSSNKGDLISAIQLGAAPIIESIVIGKEQIIILNGRTHRAVRDHVAHLREKRTTVIDDVAEMLDARIRSLSPNQVVIRIPDDRDFVSSSQAIDYSLRSIKSLVDHGTVTNENERALTATVVAADVHSTRCLRSLMSLGASLSRAHHQRVEPG